MPLLSPVCLFVVFLIMFLLINPRTYTQSHTPIVVQGGVDGTLPPWVFGMLHYMYYFETVLPSVKSLWSSLQEEVYFMGGGGVGGLWRHQPWSPCWILSIIRSQIKKVRINNYFASFHPQVLLLLLKKVEKTCIFTQKWLDHLLLMTSYLVTIVTDHH